MIAYVKSIKSFRMKCQRKILGTECYNYILECGPMPNVMAALSNIGGALCSMPQSFADAQY